ncbi:SulP family inorganic anion transporter [Geobacter sp. SVR]|uniref:SulP family inorganic anion transporter n=1 Tax=Geobacter sp. SVR TaxID=2495594 RepID=UPI00143EF751|nr:SulP family inorganic anion transporter [Geobacter sp. SVR]BCS55895.1 sodium-independent anion transporter [Geobacter sp. SVR]GCF84658.1 sodium-independent anion transporter [Geobacter sp. SVR]
MSRWTPKSVQAIKGYTRASLAADFTAGITVGLVALPLAMAFGISSGVTPQAGIYTAVVAGFLISALGGSRTQIGGPTGAFVVVIAAIIARHGLSGLLMVTMMSGVILLFLGFTGLGNAVKFIPRPVVIGFTNGIAVLIASTQIKDFLGLRTADRVPSEFIERMRFIGDHITSVNAVTVILAVASLAIILLMPRITRRIPGSIAALIGATVCVALFDIPVETIGSKFGGIPTGLPQIQLPQLRIDLILPLLPSAVTVALLAAIESLLSAVVADSMSGDRHNSNVELVAQGVANLTVPLFGGIPVTGAIARTATNIRSGARTPLAGMIHALTLLCILLFAAPLAKYIPLGTLAAVLFVVAYNMGEWREIPFILRLDRKDIAVWLITFVLTVVADLTIAVEIGMMLAALLYIYQVSRTTVVAPLTAEAIGAAKSHIVQDRVIPNYVSMFHVQGPLLFGAAEKLKELAYHLDGLQPIVILRLRYMTAIDATGLYAIEQFHEKLHASGRVLLLCGVRGQPKRLIYTSNLPRLIGARNILPHIGSALHRAQDIHDNFGGIGEETAIVLAEAPV